MSGHDEIKDAYRAIIEAVSRGDADALDGLMRPDVVDHNPIPNQSPGIAGFKQWMASARASFPDLHGAVEDVLAERDRVAGRVVFSGSQQGDLAGVEPTGKRISFTAFHMVRFSGGLAAEWWGTADLLGVLQQLGATISRP